MFDVNEDYVRRITGIRKGNISLTFEPNSSKCNGCDLWHVEIKSNTTTVAIGFGASNGEMMGSRVNGNPSVISNCRYRYEEITPEYEFVMINPDCSNPEPFCDQELEVCRPCQTNAECLRENITTYVPLDIGVVFNRYDMLAINANANASYDEQFEICDIYVNGSIVYTNRTNIEICKQNLLNFVECVNGICSGAG